MYGKNNLTQQQFQYTRMALFISFLLYTATILDSHR